MQRKNILLFSFDDAVAPWPYKTAFGEPLQTPNLDRLCDVSTAFHAAYAQAPVCGPSRASMMTTLMPSETGIYENTDSLFDRVATEEVWTYRLKQSGYFCSSGGKVHHGYKPLPEREHGILYSDGRKNLSADTRFPPEIEARSKFFGGFRRGRGSADGIDDSFYYDFQSSRSAIRFLKNYSGDQPFYREVGFYSPHMPFLAPSRFRMAYNDKAFQCPADWAGYEVDNSYVERTIREHGPLASVDWWRKTARNYFSAYSHGDYHLGRVLDALSASPHAENTVVVVVSDHGFHLGNRNLFRKRTLWEQSLHVPMIVFDPTNPVGRVVEDPVGLIDLGPTVLDYAGVARPERHHGRSLRPHLEGFRDPDRVIPSFFRGGMAIRKGRYRLIRYVDGSFQLFDVIEDYWQLRDLGQSHSAFAGMLSALNACAADCRFDLATVATLPEADADADPDDMADD